MIDEGLYVANSRQKQSSDRSRPGIPNVQPNDFRRRQIDDAQRHKVLVFCYEEEAFSRCEAPQHLIRCATEPYQPDVQTFWKVCAQKREKPLRQIFVEQQPRPLSDRHNQQPTLALSRKCEACQHILVRQLRKLGQEFLLRLPRGEEAQYLADGDPGAAHTRLAKADLRINRDS